MNNILGEHFHLLNEMRTKIIRHKPFRTRNEELESNGALYLCSSMTTRKSFLTLKHIAVGFQQRISRNMVNWFGFSIFLCVLVWNKDIENNFTDWNQKPSHYKWLKLFDRAIKVHKVEEKGGILISGIYSNIFLKETSYPFGIWNVCFITS